MFPSAKVLPYLSVLLAASRVLGNPSLMDGLHSLEKRDTGFLPAQLSTEGCRLSPKHSKFYKNKHANERIQMGECFTNSRVMGQLFAVFEPTDDTTKCLSEGGPYGLCTAFDEWPREDDIIESNDVNFACFGWTKKGGATAPQFKGREMLPYPIVCPSNLKGCYSKGVYDLGRNLTDYAHYIPTFSGTWCPPKDVDHQYAWCSGCQVGTYLQYQLENIKELGCDAKKCMSMGIDGFVNSAAKAESTTKLKTTNGKKLLKTPSATSTQQDLTNPINHMSNNNTIAKTKKTKKTKSAVVNNNGDGKEDPLGGTTTKLDIPTTYDDNNVSLCDLKSSVTGQDQSQQQQQQYQQEPQLSATQQRRALVIGNTSRRAGSLDKVHPRHIKLQKRQRL